MGPSKQLEFQNDMQESKLKNEYKFLKISKSTVRIITLPLCKGKNILKNHSLNDVEKTIDTIFISSNKLNADKQDFSI